MRNSTIHSKRAKHPTCGARAIFVDAGKPICGHCFDIVIAAVDAARKA